MGLVVLAAIGFGLSRGIGGGSGEAPVSTCGDPLDWRQAAQVEGRIAAVEGRVAEGSHEPDVGGSPTFLNLGSPHPDPDRFDVVIYEDVRERFEQPPEQAYLGREVCVTGQVRDRDGVPQIVLDSPAHLQAR